MNGREIGRGPKGRMSTVAVGGRVLGRRRDVGVYRYTNGLHHVPILVPGRSVWKRTCDAWPERHGGMVGRLMGVRTQDMVVKGMKYNERMYENIAATMLLMRRGMYGNGIVCYSGRAEREGGAETPEGGAETPEGGAETPEGGAETPEGAVTKEEGMTRNQTTRERKQGSLLPAGKKQVRIDIPAVLMDVVASPTVVEEVKQMVGDGVTGVVVKEGSGGAGEMYSVLVSLKSVVTGRALLLVEDRTDLADAVGADGVLLSETGLPIAVAKSAMQQSGLVIGKYVKNEEEAKVAAFEGAGFLVLTECSSVEMVEAARQQLSGSSVPVIVRMEENDLWFSIKQQQQSRSTLDASLGTASAGVLKHADGVMLAPKTLEEIAKKGNGDSVPRMVIEAMSEDVIIPSSASSPAVHGSIAQVSDVLSQSREDIVESQKDLLTSIAAFLEENCPVLEEISILQDSIKQLDELFLVVVVGEFNSGKSAVVNGLLGGHVVPEGILPTTNEITVMKYADVEHGEEESVQQEADGLFIRYIASDLLREINIVDTPGTNVIMERQQRLTEEFIPRADLVLFVLSADRPFTDSEVKFLKYIREWGKKVVFVVNKIDLLANDIEIGEVASFVEDNAKRLLGVDGAKAIPVSAKKATEAKIECRYVQGDDRGSGPLNTQEQEYLAGSRTWRSSRFENLESHVRDFLMGSVGGQGSESMKLKLQTPLYVTEALLDAARMQMESELDVLRKDAASIAMIRSQLDAFRQEMSKEGKVQKAEIRQQVDRIVDMVSSIIDKTMQLSNWKTLMSYLSRSRDENRSPSKSTIATATVLYSQDISQDALQRVNSILNEHTAWVDVNCSRVVENYTSFLEERMQTFGMGSEIPRASPSSWKSKATKPVTFDINMQDISTLLEDEIQQAVVSSASTAASAGGLSLFLTYVLPNTLEDLLALGLGAAIGYTSLLNIPVRRMEAKKKVAEQLQAIVKDIHVDMDRERDAAMTASTAYILAMSHPLEQHIKEEIARQATNIASLDTYLDRVYSLKKRIAEMR